METAELGAAEAAWLEGWRKGPVRTRWTRLPVQDGDAAPDADLTDSEGRPQRLSDLWRDQPLVLIFLRHFGCSCTAGRLERLAAELPKLRQEGAAVVAVCRAEPERAQAFKAARGLEVPLLCDPGRQSYEAYGLLEATPPLVVYGAGDDFLRRDFAAGEALLAARRGTARVPVDSPWQMPGDFVIDRGGRLRLAHRPCYCDGAVELDVLVAALRLGAIAP